MYDWANSAFFTTIVAAMFPAFYRSLAISAGLSEANATASWAYTTSIALLIAALLGPLLGAVSDQTGGKKKFIAAFVGSGVLATAMMVFLGKDTYLAASLLFIIGNVSVAASNVFYESLLPHITTPDTIDRVSAKGYAIGYLGGGILLVLNILWYLFPEFFFLPSQVFAVKLSFFSVAIWWGVFSVPLFRHVPEPYHRLGSKMRSNPVKAGFLSLVNTLRQVMKYRQLLLFLVAFWLYSDGIGTIMKMAVAYGDEIGIDVTDLILALIMTQFIGIPCSFAFGWLADQIGTKPAILIGLLIYAVITLGAFFIASATHFYILAFLVGLVQGGTQALSRSLFGSMTPKSQSAEFFGFFSASSKFAGILGPLLFGIVSQGTGDSRISILSILVFFVGGAILLSFVNVEEGRMCAGEEAPTA
jgi:UMF1 family MFS transporter